MSSKPLKFVELEPSGPHRHTLVWLHGLGADGSDLLPLANSLALQNVDGIKHVFPHAPFRQSQIWNDAPIHAWYRFDLPAIGQGDNDADIHESIQQVETLLKAERSALPSDGRLIIGGFSQGGLIALATGLETQVNINGIVALSTYLWKKTKPSNILTSVYMAHGMADPIIPIAIARASASRLENAGILLEWHEYTMGHSICQEEVHSLSIWLQHQLTDNIINVASTED